jgi:hypothetical protein
MADPVKKKAKVPVIVDEPVEEEYELLPHKEIIELKDELRRLKSVPTGAGKEVALGELAEKIDKLLDIFTEAMHQMRIEEGGVSFKEKMQPFTEKMNKILEQNSEIAEGIVALADIMNEVKSTVEEKLKVPKIGMPSHVVRPKPSSFPGIGPAPGMPPMPGGPGLRPMPSGAPPVPPLPSAGGPAGMPPIPPPPKKKGLFK